VARCGSFVTLSSSLRRAVFLTEHSISNGIQNLANLLNPKIRGWIQYYGKISRKSQQPVLYYIHQRIIKWILNKYKRFKGSKIKAIKWLEFITKSCPNMLYHWDLGFKLV